MTTTDTDIKTMRVIGTELIALASYLFLKIENAKDCERLPESSCLRYFFLTFLLEMKQTTTDTATTDSKTMRVIGTVTLVTLLDP